MKTLFEINHEGLNEAHEKRDHKHMTNLDVTHNDMMHTHEKHGFKGKNLEVHHFD